MMDIRKQLADRRMKLRLMLWPDYKPKSPVGARQYSQKAVARALGVNKRSYQKWEEMATTPKVEHLHAWARYLGAEIVLREYR